MPQSSNGSAGVSRSGTPLSTFDAPILPMYHPEFYFEDGNLVILVESTLFRVFRSTFARHSPLFKALFTIPAPAGRIAEGSTDEYPLVLEGTSSVDFERLLWIMYPPTYGAHRAHTADEWASVLSLATRWEFSDLRALAIRELQAHAAGMSAVDKVVLAREFDIGGRWALDAYAALCARAEPLAVAEACRLGLETTVRIAQLREQLRACGRVRGRASSGTSTSVGGARTGCGGAGGVEDAKTEAAQRRRWDNGSKTADRRGVVSPGRGSERPNQKAANGALSEAARLVADAFRLELF